VAQHKTVIKRSGNGRASKQSPKKAGTSRPSRAGSPHSASAGDEPISIDRRRGVRRQGEEQESSTHSSQATPQLERRKKVNRRRQIDPTTCERDYTDEEVEFMNALDEYKRKSGRMFPTCSEVLEVVRGLGYVKIPPADFEVFRQTIAISGSAKPMPDDWQAQLATEASVDDCSLVVSPASAPQPVAHPG
jgi:hypothetical protein